MKFDEKLLQTGKTSTGIVVPKEIIDGLGSGKKPKVVAIINGYSFRTSVGVMDGIFMLPVSSEVRSNSGVSAGDDVEVDLTVDTEVREVALPEDFVVALASSPAAKAKFESISYSNKRRYIIPIEAAKTPETRQRRIEKTIAELES